MKTKDKRVKVKDERSELSDMQYVVTVNSGLKTVD